MNKAGRGRSALAQPSPGPKGALLGVCVHLHVRVHACACVYSSSLCERDGTDTSHHKDSL